MSAFTSHTVRNERRSALMVTSRQRPGQGLGRSLEPPKDASHDIGRSKVTRTTTRPGRTTAPFAGNALTTWGRPATGPDRELYSPGPRLVLPALQPLFDRPGKRNSWGAFIAASAADLQASVFPV